MGYAVELSFDISKSGSFTAKQELIAIKAREYNSSTQYSMHEIEGYGRKTTRNESINVVMFEDNDFDSMLDFIGEIRKEKISSIDCIYTDEISCNLLYASPKYLRRLDKPSSLEIRRSMKKTEDESILAVREALRLNC
ncbi:MAG: hypothetical protein CMB96_04870 [Flavobacteriaceae bacterium]|nr:hypothetical protein [Flavobacteriaceae bacterium]|tara:strand:- start:268 stop:681 length:414 start_codon:yes stop_codon:yes gene_type:complete